MELVSIKEASDILEHNAPKNPRRQWGVMVRMATNTVAKALAERKTGKWFDSADVYDKRAHKHDYFCLECKTHAMDFICGSEDWWCGKPPKYCPNCGAKMEVDE